MCKVRSREYTGEQFKLLARISQAGGLVEFVETTGTDKPLMHAVNSVSKTVLGKPIGDDVQNKLRHKYGGQPVPAAAMKREINQLFERRVGLKL